MRARSLFVVFCSITMALPGCGDDTDGPTVTDRGAKFAVDSGERFDITLKSNVTTGYAWELSAELPAEVVRLVDDRYVGPGVDAAGAGGHQVLTFEAVADGTALIELWYVASFDDPPEAADRAEFEVVVGSGAADAIVPAPDAGEAISVSELLASGPSDELVLSGLLFDDGGGLAVCETLAESNPPQCVGARVDIANPGAVTADFTETGGVRWTDRPVALTGRLVDVAFVVSS